MTPKAGDRLICVDAPACGNMIREGGEYICAGIGSDGLVELEGFPPTAAWGASRFDLATTQPAAVGVPETQCAGCGEWFQFCQCSHDQIAATGPLKSGLPNAPFNTPKYTPQPRELSERDKRLLPASEGVARAVEAMTRESIRSAYQR